MKKKSRMDFFKCLNNDVVLNILMRLDPADLVLASVISRHWKDFVTSSELSKQLCLRHYPQVANLVDVYDATTARKRKRRKINREIPKVANNTYALLHHVFQKLKSSPTDCIKDKVSASYYHNKTKEEADAIPEKFIFKLKYDQCIITEINMRPYREYLKGVEEEEAENYSTKSVRFRMGFRKTLRKKGATKNTADEFIWTYTSPEFPMGQVCKELRQLGVRGQRFELPEAVLCIGGYVMVELLGRVQMDADKGPYYIKIAGANVLGRSLSPAFKAEVRDPGGKFDLKYDSSRLGQTIKTPPIKWRSQFSVRGRGSGRGCACGCQIVEIVE